MNLIPVPSCVSLKGDMLRLCGKDYTEYITEKTLSPDYVCSEAYTLVITSDSIRITAGGDDGIFRALTTLRQISLSYLDCLPCLEINDAPRFSYRGFMIDSARHIQTVDELKMMIDAASLFKFNTFHWHIADDQGFRIELDAFPDITEKASVRKSSDFSKRVYSTEPYGGYYTKAQMREIVDYCHERYITVIPEFDMPGHTTALIHAMPELSCKGVPLELKTCGGVFSDILCAGNEKVYEIVFKILDELCEIFTDEYFHIGGDEAPKVRWENCEKCKKKLQDEGLENFEELQGYFVNRIARYLKGKGKTVIAWNESLNGKNLDEDIIIQHWMDRRDVTVDNLNKGGKTVISSFKPYYVDYPYGMYPLNDVYKYEPTSLKGLTALGKNSIIGTESPVWAEQINNIDRMAYQCFPRWLAIAETAWSAPENKELLSFLNRAEFFCDYLSTKGVHCAKKSEWNPPVHKRLPETLGFFKGSLTLDTIKGFLFNYEKE